MQPASERVWEGPKLKLGGDTKATIAVILWSAGPAGRNPAAEWSFRLGDGEHEFDVDPAAASDMHEFSLAVQSLDWCLPESRTKTQFAYGVGQAPNPCLPPGRGRTMRR
jgi:hypothetical protein